MDAASNKQLIRRLYDELNKGNMQPFLEHLANEIRWTVIGTTKFSGTITGKQDVIDKLFNRVASQLDGRAVVIIKNIIAEGDHVVVESSGQAITKAGRPYNNTYCEIYRFHNGKIQEVTIYLDTSLIERVLGGGTK
jgi:ketosteroid isomerase-like protein